MQKQRSLIKCVVWDLDQTLWQGVLLEEHEVSLPILVRSAIQEFDRRGILQSIASKNDEGAAKNKLRELSIDEYFLYPQIHWRPKSASIQDIANLLNISTDAFAFIDDQAFERDEVQHVLPNVLCLSPTDLPTLLLMPEMIPPVISSDTAKRRLFYLNDQKRQKMHKDFIGTNEAFLSTLQMRLSITEATGDDLVRAVELTMRTHQLNTTGYTYSYAELDNLRRSSDHFLLVCELEDRYGSHGKIGLALLGREPEYWVIKLLLMSCRVLSYGVGSLLLHYLIKLASESGVRLRAEFITTSHNRMMFVTYKFNGFQVVHQQDNHYLLEHDGSQPPAFPSYVELYLNIS